MIFDSFYLFYYYYYLFTYLFLFWKNQHSIGRVLDPTIFGWGIWVRGESLITNPNFAPCICY